MVLPFRRFPALLLALSLAGCTQSSAPEKPLAPSPAAPSSVAPSPAAEEPAAESPSAEKPAAAGASVEEKPPAEPPAPQRSLAGEWRDTPPGPGDKGCFAEQNRPAVVETVTEHVQIAPEMRDPQTGAVTAPAAYRTSTQARIVEGRAKMWFAVLCKEELTPELVATLQRALAARGLYAGPASGQMNSATAEAIRAYQRPRGLFSGTLSRRAAQEMGLVPWQDAGVAPAYRK